MTELHTDASVEGYGAILLQKESEGNAFHPFIIRAIKLLPWSGEYRSLYKL